MFLCSLPCLMILLPNANAILLYSRYWQEVTNERAHVLLKILETSEQAYQTPKIIRSQCNQQLV